jgi:predicted urease superfamily metal-dependent hydrolase
VVYFFWPETARLSLEEVARNFGDEVAVHVYDASEEEKKELDGALHVSGIPKPRVVARVQNDV